MPRRASSPPDKAASAASRTLSGGGKPAAAHSGRNLPEDLTRLAQRGFLIARDAAFNVKDLLTHSSRMAFLAIKDCEKELDLIERQIDEGLPVAITRVNEDLVLSVALRVQARTSRIPASDVRQLVEMSSILRDMLETIDKGFSSSDVECARKVLQMDKDIDRICHSLFQEHLAENVPQGDTSGFEILLMAQALERAGDHTTNLAEELYSLVEGRSLRHVPKKKAN